MEVYTDGSCFYKTKDGGWAFCIIENDLKIFELAQKEKNTTVSRMEIEAAIQALDWVYKNKTEIDIVQLYSDSQYLVKTMNEGWNKFRNNHDLWTRLDALVDLLQGKVEFIWIRGHDKNKWNEYVDGMASYKS